MRVRTQRGRIRRRGSPHRPARRRADHGRRHVAAGNRVNVLHSATFESRDLTGPRSRTRPSSAWPLRVTGCGRPASAAFYHVTKALISRSVLRADPSRRRAVGLGCRRPLPPSWRSPRRDHSVPQVQDCRRRGRQLRHPPHGPGGHDDRSPRPERRARARPPLRRLLPKSIRILFFVRRLTKERIPIVAGRIPIVAKRRGILSFVRRLTKGRIPVVAGRIPIVAERRGVLAREERVLAQRSRVLYARRRVPPRTRPVTSRSAALRARNVRVRARG